MVSKKSRFLNREDRRMNIEREGIVFRSNKRSILGGRKNPNQQEYTRGLLRGTRGAHTRINIEETTTTNYY